MRALHALAGLVAAVILAGPAQAQRPVSIPPGLIEDVRYLSDDRLAGRLTGSAGADSAAEYIARRFAEVGLQPGREGWFQEFQIAPDAPGVQRAKLPSMRARNVIGILPGRDPVLRREAVIVGAHYDHLGSGQFGTLNPDSAGKIHNGADDNASGTAALIHIARTLAESPPLRTVVFIAFTGEELGLFGSAHYVKEPLYGLESTVAMINLDMVGRLRNGRLIVYGTETAREFPALLDSLNWYQGFDLKKQGDGYGPSDQSSFYAAKRPVLHLFTDLHEDYHRTTDDWEKINFEGMARVISFTSGLASALGGRSAALTFVEVPVSASHAMVERSDSLAIGGSGAVTRGYGAYLGSIPDMTSSPGGVKLMGVSKGGPAEKAGLRAGDIITRIGAHEVTDLQAMTVALRSFKPGDSTAISLIRGTDTLKVDVTFGQR
ncbi:MAG TPA: M20/M25/M40 family metallo-hydrolase [Gemmatimonadales bacterium]|nr:M20/M25/M40 family metallo-hydrolase [Gemmatimonadales bacterium]